jgi:anti-sigma B factor antagonist
LISEFRVEVESLDAGIRAFTVAGELDQATAPELSGPLMDVAESHGDSVLIDFAECEFIDSTGLAVLVEARERIRDANGRSFSICCPNAQVRRLLEITGIDRSMALYESREEALAALRG